MNKFWNWRDSVSNSVDTVNSELILEGPIADETWWGDEVTPALFREELKNHKGDSLTVILNSGGGDVFAGLSIYNALRDLDAKVTIKVDGLAASVASIIAMAGDKIIMSPGTMMMIHRPSVFAMGNAEDLAMAREMLLEIEESIIPIYVDRTGQSAEAVTDMLDAETWMSADKAVELGFADEVSETIKKPGVADSVQNLFSGKFAFSMSATKASMDSFVSKIAASQEGKVTDNGDDPVVPEDPLPPAPDVDTEEVVKPEVEEVVETPTEEDIKPTEEEEVTMSKEEDIAKGQVIAPADQAPVTPKADVKNYLKTRASVEDFAHVLHKNAGASAQEVKDAWAEHLKAKMGITNPEILLPTALIRSIEDAFKEGGEIWSLVNKTGLTVFRAAVDTVTGENSRAKGYNRDDEATKAEQTITLDDRVVRAQFIYKYITLNKEDIKENRDTGALVTYVLTELPRRIVREVERAIVIGDGREAGSDYKITSFLSLKDDAAGDGTFVLPYTPAEDESKYETLLRARSLVKADGAKYLVAKAGWLTDLLLEQGVNGGYLFAPGTNVGSVFSFAGVIEPDWMDEDEDNDAYIFVPSAYTTVGDNTIEAYTNFLLSTNKQEYLQEIYAGGAVTRLNAGVAIGAAASS